MSFLLSSKLAVPQVNPLFSPRAEVIAKLQVGLTGPLTTLVAGPGYGKSMHLAWFVRQLAVPVCWMQVDEWDGVASRFLTYLRQAVLAPGDQSGLVTSPPSAEALMTEIAARAQDSGSLVLVLDDLHAAPGSFVVQFLLQLARTAPPELHLYVAARPSLLLPAGWLRAAGQMTEIEQSDLCLNEAEAAALLSCAAGQALSEPQIHRATLLVAGWGAGLVLMGAALRRNPAWNLSTGRLPKELDHYLVEETWAGFSPAEQKLLESTCLVRRMTPELATGLFGEGDWQELLDRLHRGYGTVIATLAGQFTLHPLWDKFLSDKLTNRLGRAGVEIRSREIAAALAARGLPFEAAQLYLRAHAYEEAAACIADLAPAGGWTAYPMALAEALGDLPELVLQTQPWLALVVAHDASARGQFAEATDRAQQAAAGFQRDQDRMGLAIAAVLQSTLAMTGGDTDSARRFLDEGFAALAPGMELSRTMLLEQRWLLMRAGESPSLEAQEEHLQEVLRLYRHLPGRQVENEARVLNWLGVVAMERGHLAIAIQRLEQAVEQLSQTGSPPWESGFNLGAALSAACRFTDALAIFLPMSQRSDRPMRRLIAALNLLDIYVTLDDPVKAEAAARRALELADHLKTPHLAARARAELARLYRLQGEYDFAVQEAEAAIAYAAKGADRHVELDARLVLAEAALWSRTGTAGPSGAPHIPTETLADPLADVRRKVVSGLHLVGTESRPAREEGTTLLREALRQLSQHSFFPSFVQRHWDLALTLAVVGLAAGTLPNSCRDILHSLEELPESVRKRGLCLPDTAAHFLRPALSALTEAEGARLMALLPPYQQAAVAAEGVVSLRVRVLGRFSLRLNGEPLPDRGLGRRRARALLLTLLLMPRGVEREVLCDWLWPDAERTAGQNLLRVSLHHLRRLLEPHRPPEAPSAFVRSIDGKLFWAPEATRADVWDLQEQLRLAAQALRQGDKARAAQANEQAVALYRGPLALDDCAWLEEHREHLNRQVLQALRWLTNFYKPVRPDRSIACLQRLLDLEPGDEEAARELMCLLGRAGLRAEVARVYRRCCQYLKQELGVSVSAATAAVYLDAAGLSGTSVQPH